MAVALALAGSVFAFAPAVASPVEALTSVYTLTTTSGAQGAAFAVSDADFVTAAHVVEGADVVRLEGTQTPPVVIDAVVRYRDESNDIAVLQLASPQTGAVLPLAWRDDDAQPGLEVFALGSPIDGVVLSTGVVLGTDEEGLIRSSTPVDPGNSGGPLLDDEGSVAGVVIAESELTGDAYSVPASVARDAVEAASHVSTESMPTPAGDGSRADTPIAWLALWMSLIAVVLAVTAVVIALLRRPRMQAPPINITLD